MTGLTPGLIVVLQWVRDGHALQKYSNNPPRGMAYIVHNPHLEYGLVISKTKAQMLVRKKLLERSFDGEFLTITDAGREALK
jgi:hypothetical protein